MFPNFNDAKWLKKYSSAVHTTTAFIFNVFEENFGQENHVIIVTSSSVFKMLSVHTKMVYEKLRLQSGITVWTEGLTVEIKLRFQISPN